MQFPDRLLSLEARLRHYHAEVLGYLRGPGIKQDPLATQDLYYYCCALVDRCLAQHVVSVEGDFDRLEKVRRLSRVNPVFVDVYEALRDLEEGYRGKISRLPVPTTAQELEDIEFLANRLITVVDPICPSPQASS